jgi:hypothetical protein
MGCTQSLFKLSKAELQKQKEIKYRYEALKEEHEQHIKETSTDNNFLNYYKYSSKNK